MKEHLQEHKKKETYNKTKQKIQTQYNQNIQKIEKFRKMTQNYN